MSKILLSFTKYALWQAIFCITFFQLSTSIGHTLCKDIFRSNINGGLDATDNKSPEIRSKLAVTSGVTHFLHRTSGRSLIEILRLKEISSFNRAQNIHQSSPRKYNGNSDVVYLMAVEYSSERFNFPDKKYGVYYASDVTNLNETITIFFKPQVIDNESFGWASQLWRYGKMDTAHSFKSDRLVDFFSNRDNWRIQNEIIFNDKIQISVDDIDFIIASNSSQRDFLIRRLKNAYGPSAGKKKWEDIIRSSDTRPYTNDPFKLADQEFYEIEGGDIAFDKIRKLDRNRAKRIAKLAEKNEKTALYGKVMDFLIEEDFSEFARIARIFNSAQESIYLSKVAEKVSANEIKNSDDVQAFLRKHINHSEEVRRLIADQSIVQGYFEQNFHELVLDLPKFVREYGDQFWNDEIKAGLKKQLKTKDDNLLLKIGLSSSIKEKLNGKWVKEEIFQILQQRGRQDYVELFAIEDSSF